jgi:putative hemolysin
LESDSESLLLLALFSEIVLSLVAVLLLIISSGLVSGAEIAFFSLTANDLSSLDEKAHSRLFWLKNRPKNLLATILISNNFINIAIVILSESILSRTLPTEIFQYWAEQLTGNHPNAPIFAKALSFLITVVGVTFILVLFGEIMPKVYAKINNIRLAKFMSNPLFLLMQLFRPLVFGLVNWTTLIENRLFNRTPPGSLTSKEDIDEAINLTVRNEKNSGTEVDILKSILKFGEVSARQIMQPRVDVVALDIKSQYTEVLQTVRSSGYSRIPVFSEDLDHISGILYAKDLIGLLHENDDYEWQTLVRTNILYVPEAKKISDLLKNFQKERLHMAIVVDEYGGTAGIVTLEDIMEEVIGDIKDEFDDEAEVDFIKIDDKNFVFEGKTLLKDVCRLLELDSKSFDLIRGEADSLAGLILEINGSFPRKEAEIAYNQFRFKVVSVNNRRIEKVKLTLI